MNTEKTYNVIDIREDYLLKKDDLLETLLKDKTTGNNIFWATYSYEKCRGKFAPMTSITTDLITSVNGNLIQPRTVKSKIEQLYRTKDKAEVFTSLSMYHL